MREWIQVVRCFDSFCGLVVRSSGQWSYLLMSLSENDSEGSISKCWAFERGVCVEGTHSCHIAGSSRPLVSGLHGLVQQLKKLILKIYNCLPLTKWLQKSKALNLFSCPKRLMIASAQNCGPSPNSASGVFVPWPSRRHMYHWTPDQMRWNSAHLSMYITPFGGPAPSPRQIGSNFYQKL